MSIKLLRREMREGKSNWLSFYAAVSAITITGPALTALVASVLIPPMLSKSYYNQEMMTIQQCLWALLTASNILCTFWLLVARLVTVGRQWNSFAYVATFSLGVFNPLFGTLLISKYFL
jgi:hypothetical protein